MRESKETRRQYSARRLRVRIERAKVAIMDAQQELAEEGFALNPRGFQEMLDAALARLDAAWGQARQVEKADDLDDA